MKNIAAAFLIATACLQPARAASKSVSFQVYKTSPGHYIIREPFLPLDMHIDAQGDNFSFGSLPIAGEIWKSGTFLNFSGGDVYGSVSVMRGEYSANVTVYTRDASSPARQLHFTLYPNIRSDDPAYLPDYTISGNVGSTSLRARPMFNKQGYEVSGFVDMDQFGIPGTAVFSLITAVAMHTITTPKAAAGRLAPLPFPLK